MYQRDPGAHCFLSFSFYVLWFQGMLHGLGRSGGVALSRHASDGSWREEASAESQWQQQVLTEHSAPAACPTGLRIVVGEVAV